jgi:hypothetical protein
VRADARECPMQMTGFGAHRPRVCSVRRQPAAPSPSASAHPAGDDPETRSRARRRQGGRSRKRPLSIWSKRFEVRATSRVFATWSTRDSEASQRDLHQPHDRGWTPALLSASASCASRTFLSAGPFSPGWLRPPPHGLRRLNPPSGSLAPHRPRDRPASSAGLGRPKSAGLPEGVLPLAGGAPLSGATAPIGAVARASPPSMSPRCDGIELECSDEPLELPGYAGERVAPPTELVQTPA